jgi:hypothetical protein
LRTAEPDLRGHIRGHDGFRYHNSKRNHDSYKSNDEQTNEDLKLALQFIEGLQLCADLIAKGPPFHFVDATTRPQYGWHGRVNPIGLRTGISALDVDGGGWHGLSCVRYIIEACLA